MKVQLLPVVFSFLIAVSAVKYSFAEDLTSVPNAIISESITQKASVVRPDESVLEENNYHYLYKGKPVHLQRIKDRYLIQYNKSSALTAPRFKQKRYFRNASYRRSKVSGNSFDIVTIDRKHVGNRTGGDIASELQSEVASDQSVQYATPVYFEPQSGEELLITNRIVVRVADKDYSELQKSISSAIDVVFEREIMPQVLIFKCQNLQNSDALERCAVIERMPGVVWAEPDMIQSTKNCFIPDDPLYNKEWHHKNDGSSGSTAGADMSVTTAWDIQQMADTNITIAVFDQGIDLTHPDLRLVQGRNCFDTTTPPSPSNPTDNHGTAVAGIAAAIGNNGIGVAGVGAGARIMPIKILDDYGRTTTADKVDAITWAMNHGADIMNNSWISTGTTPAATLEEAIKHASVNGRNGKGCLMFFGSGNDASTFKSQSIRFSYTTPYYVSFVYKKDASGSYGSDNVCVDNIIIYGNNGDSVVYLETFAGTSLPSGWSTFGGTNGSPTIDNSKGWFRCDTVHQSGFSEDTISFCSGAISDNQWTELRMPLRTFHPGEQIKCNYRISSEDGHDSLLIKLFYGDGTEAAVYNIASGMRSSIPYVYYPAAMDSAIAVGASTDLDYRSDYSQYDVSGTGKTVDFLAPSGGGFFGTTTTDRTGTAGYDTTADYTSTFSGTSSACPAASGLAALILSKNTHLSRNKVLEVMRSTCDTIGGVTYTNGVHKEYGHGRLNALRAIENLPPVITGQNPLAMTSNGNLTISTSNLIIFDAETPFGPFTPTVYDGTDYTVSNNYTITTSLATGTLRVPVSINDGRYESDICTLSVNVRSSNAAPSITSQHQITTLEDQGYRITSSDLVITDSDDPSGPFLITASTGANYTISHDSIIPSPDYNGTLTVPVTASDGLAASAVFNVTITVTPVNDPPSFTAIGNQSILEDAGPQTVQSWASISAGPNETDPITFNVTTSNPGLFRNLPSLSSSGILSYTPAQDANGAADVRVRIFDGADSGNAVTFSITIAAVNDAPSFVKGPDITIEERSTPYTVTGWATLISMGASDESAQHPTYNVSLTNTALFTTPPKISETGTLTFTPAAGQTGTSVVTVALADDGETTNGGINVSPPQQFTITILHVNTPPSFTKGQDITISEDTGAISIALWAQNINRGSPGDSGQILNFTVFNNDSTLFTIQPQIDSNGTLSLATAPNRYGTARIIARLHDNGGGNDSSAADTFTVSILNVNDPPSFRAGIQPQILEDAGAQNIPLWAGDISSGPYEIDSLYFKCTTNHPEYFAIQPSVSRNGNLSYSILANTSGIATVYVSLHDTTASYNLPSFTITIIDVNDAPSFNLGPNVSVDEDAGYKSYSYWASAISAGPNETQTLTFFTSATPSSLFTLQPSVTPDGTLTFSTAPNANGTALVHIRLRDSGGIANGGIDSVRDTTFSITITPVNDKPTITVSGLNEMTSGTQSSVTITAADPDGTTPSIVVSEKPAFCQIVNSGSNTVIVSYHPAIADTGVFNFKVSAGDGTLFTDSTISMHIIAPPPGKILIQGVSPTAMTRINATSSWSGYPALTGPGFITNLKNGTYSLSISETGYKTVYTYGTISSGSVDTVTFIQHSPVPLMVSSALPLQTTSGNLNAGGLVSVVIDDADNDKKSDIVYTGTDGKIYQCKGNGTSYSAPSLIYSGFSGHNTLRCLDWNSDGLNDLLLFNFNGTVWLCRGNESGQLQHDTVLFALSTSGCTGMDIVQQTNGSRAFYTGFSDGTIRYLTLTDDGTQLVSIVRDRNGQPIDVGNDADVSVFDLSGDGKMELLAGNSSGAVKIFSMKTVDTASGSYIFAPGGIPTGQNGRVSLSSSIGKDSTLSVIVFSDNNGAIYRSTTGVRGDVTEDGKVDVLDLQQLGIHWGKRSTEVGWTSSVNLSATEPVTGTQIINVLDLQVLGNSWGLRK